MGESKSARQYWLVKSEPEAYSFSDLYIESDQTTCWDGVRNYQARNFMRDQMRLGDGVLFYHSNTSPPGVVGIAEVVREAYPDHTQFEPKALKYDPKSYMNAPRWWMVDIQARLALQSQVTLAQMRREASLSHMRLLQRGNRLSILPTTEADFWTIIQMGGVQSVHWKHECV
ncbi:MAG: EVE domain-containing protein [Myxococcota bacterium]